jgi:type IV secretory pathway VirB10-like protein
VVTYCGCGFNQTTSEHSSSSSADPKKNKTFLARNGCGAIIFVFIMSAVLGTTIAVLYVNYCENTTRKNTKIKGVVLDHWGKGAPTKKEMDLLKLSLNDMLPPPPPPLPSPPPPQEAPTDKGGSSSRSERGKAEKRKKRKRKRRKKKRKEEAAARNRHNKDEDKDYLNSMAVSDDVSRGRGGSDRQEYDEPAAAAAD